MSEPRVILSNLFFFLSDQQPKTFNFVLSKIKNWANIHPWERDRFGPFASKMLKWLIFSRSTNELIKISLLNDRIHALLLVSASLGTTKQSDEKNTSGMKSPWLSVLTWTGGRTLSEDAAVRHPTSQVAFRSDGLGCFHRAFPWKFWAPVIDDPDCFSFSLRRREQNLSYRERDSVTRHE